MTEFFERELRKLSNCFTIRFPGFWEYDERLEIQKNRLRISPKDDASQLLEAERANMVSQEGRRGS